MTEPFDLNLRHLRALIAVGRLGTMSAAAGHVGMSQPALTQGLAKLERQIGTVLLDRLPKGVQHTPAGTALAMRAEAAFDHLARGASAARGVNGRGFVRPDDLMTSTQLRAFLAVADHGSFVAAAHATGLTAPSLHRAVRDLEHLGSGALLENRGRGVQLSSEGRALARGIRLAGVELSAGIFEATGDTARARDIRIGAMPLPRASLLPHAIAACLNARSGIGLHVVEGSWLELVEPLQDGRLDLMVGALRATVPPDLEQETLFEDELVVIGRAGHPLAGQAADVEALRGFPWVVPPAGTPLLAQWDVLFASGPRPATPLVCGSTVVIRGTLAGTDLLTLLSPDQVSVEIMSGQLAVISRPEGLGRRMIGLTVRRGWRPTGPQSAFLSALRASAAARLRKNL